MKNALTTTHQAQVHDFSDAFEAAIRQAQKVAKEQEIIALCNETLKLVPRAEQALISRCILALDEAGMGEHSVYVQWSRIDYGCWMDAEEVVNAGGMSQYLEALGMDASDVQELMEQGYEIQDAEGLAAKCLGDQGDLDWEKLGEVIEVIGSYFKAA